MVRRQTSSVVAQPTDYRDELLRLRKIETPGCIVQSGVFR
ncbi:MAG: hypothetical protein ACI8P0_004696 [Planctomycetaceae bacterium]